MIITSQSKAYPGTVTIYDRLTLPQVELVEAALSDMPPITEGKVALTALDKPRLPALLACVEKWDLKGFPDNVTVENFPLTPRRQAHDLIMQIFVEIAKVYNGELDVPNE